MPAYYFVYAGFCVDLEAASRKIAWLCPSFSSSALFRKYQEFEMVRTKRNDKPSGNGNNSSGGFRGKPQFQWLNVALTDDDIIALEQDETPLADFAALLLEVGLSGFDYSIKSASSGNTVVCSIYRSASDTVPGGIGVSGFATNIRDAIAVCYYKFAVRLESTLVQDTEQGGANQHRFR
jgi:hypothetical protein